MSDSATLLHLDIEKVVVTDDRLRAVDPEKVAQLAQSMVDVGQITPIEVGVATAGVYPLIIGAHRLAAAKVAGFHTINAVLFDGTPDQRRLREIDENLYRHELTPYDQAAFLAERRAIFERLQGPVKAGRKGRASNSDNLSPNRQLSFFDDLLEKFGLPKRAVQRALKRRHGISAEAWLRLRGHAVAKVATELDKLARLDEARQLRVVKLMLQETRPAKNVTEALRALADGPVESIDDKQLRVLMAAWNKAGKKARAEFLRAIKADARKSEGKAQTEFRGAIKDLASEASAG